MERGWHRCGVGMGSLWPRMAPAGLPRTRQRSRPLGRHGGPQRLRAVLGEEPGATWVRGRLHGDASTRLLGGCSPRAPPGCSPWGRGQWVVGFRIGGVARAIPLKILGAPDPWSGSRVRRAGGAQSGLWGCRGDECHSGAAAEPPGFRWGEGSGDGDGAGDRRGCCGNGGADTAPTPWAARQPAPAPQEWDQCPGATAGHTGTLSHAGYPQGARVPHPLLRTGSDTRRGLLGGGGPCPAWGLQVPVLPVLVCWCPSGGHSVPVAGGR